MEISKNRKIGIFTYKSSLVLISILFFFSGASGLIYQTVWVRLLEIYFGVTLTAITLIVSAYMAGLGVGSLLGGRIASKSRNNILLFGIVQIGIGVFGIFSPVLINLIGKNTAGSPYILVFLLSFVLLLIPTVLMGMTLPFLVQTFISNTKNSGETIGLLYGINTLGAALGALVSGYLLIGWFGFNGALLVSVIINFIVGLGALSIKKVNSVQTIEYSASTANDSYKKSSPWKLEAIMVSAFLVGFIGMGFEMLWVRLLGIIGKHTAYSFPSILFIFLMAFAVGGWFWGRRADKSDDPIKLFWQLQITIGIFTAFSFFIVWGFINLPQFQPLLSRNFNNIQQPIPLTPYVNTFKDGIVEVLVFSKRIFLNGLLEYFLPILVMVFPAALLMGGSLPILDRIAIDQADVSGRRVGDIHLANIIGSVSGTLITSFIFLPMLGSELTHKILSFLTISFLFIAILTKKTLFRKYTFLLSLTLIILIILLPGKEQFYTRFYQNVTKNQNVIIKESGDSILAITFREEMKDPSGLWIGGLLNSYFPSIGEYERSAMTCAAAVQPKRVLVIGLGGGNTAKFLASLPNIDEIVIIELMEDLGSFLDDYVPSAKILLSNPKVNYIIDDGRRYLYAHPEEKFDLIFIDPMWSYQAGHNNLYSQEAMRLYQSHLTKSGVFCAWVNEGHFIPKTAVTIFKYSDFYSDFLVNSNQPIVYDMTYMSTVYDSFIKTLPAHLSDRTLDMINPKLIMKGKVSDQTLTLKNEINTPVLMDMTPWLEYFYICPTIFLNDLSTYQLRYCSQKY